MQNLGENVALQDEGLDCAIEFLSSLTLRALPANNLWSLKVWHLGLSIVRVGFPPAGNSLLGRMLILAHTYVFFSGTLFMG